MASQPNILYLHSHDTGRYIQPYGYAVPTPNLQRLAEQGIVFRQAFCASPTCSPSRSALLTGMAPHNNGMMGLAHFGFQLNDYGQHMLHTLRKAGYYSALAGMQHIDKMSGQRIGYDAILTAEDMRQGKGFSTVEERVEEFLKNAPQPFFLSVGYEETHRVFPEADVNPNYLRPPAPIPDLPETRADMAGFVTSARILDQRMGRVLAALDENGLADNTLVICTTDHGLAFPLMKCNLTDHGTGVMLILRGPGGFDGGKVIDSLVSQIDLFPTVCDLAGVEKPGWLQGKSLLPLVNGQAEDINEEVFTEVTFHVSYQPMRAVRTKRWKLIRLFDDWGRTVLPNSDDSLTKSMLMDNGWRDRPAAPVQLYDLIFDPNEAHNLAGDPAYESVVDELSARLDRWMRETGDPLLHGPIEWPDGFPRLEPGQTSPSELRFH